MCLQEVEYLTAADVASNGSSVVNFGWPCWEGTVVQDRYVGYLQ